jgi:hypothetical protein
MNEIQQKQLKILEDTFSYYTENVSRRTFSIDKNGWETCLYFDSNTNNMCAIGRYLGDMYIPEMENKAVEEIFNILPDELQSLGSRFLRSIQTFHDEDSYWCDNGITNTGLAYYKRVKNNIEIGTYLV